MIIRILLISFIGFAASMAHACPDLKGNFLCKNLRQPSRDPFPISITQTAELIELKNPEQADGRMTYDLKGKPLKKSWKTAFKKTIEILSVSTCSPLVLQVSEVTDDQVHRTETLREYYREKGKLILFSKYIITGKIAESTFFECEVK